MKSLNKIQRWIVVIGVGCLAFLFMYPPFEQLTRLGGAHAGHSYVFEDRPAYRDVFSVNVALLIAQAGGIVFVTAVLVFAFHGIRPPSEKDLEYRLKAIKMMSKSFAAIVISIVFAIVITEMHTKEIDIREKRISSDSRKQYPWLNDPIVEGDRPALDTSELTPVD